MAKKTLEQKGGKVNKNWKIRNKSKRWFDLECQELKKGVRTIGRKKIRKPNDNLLKKKYHEKLKEFKKKCKSKRNIFWQRNIREVEKSLADPNTFWKKWENVNETVTSPLIHTISGDKWYAHFKGLHAGTIETNLDEQQFSSNEDMGRIENGDMGRIENGDMGRIENDKPYTRKEFDSVINNMKDGKTMGSESISNEMIKNSLEIILEICKLMSKKISRS